MAKTCKKYMNVDVIAFLEEKMKSNTKSYQGDFEKDKDIFNRLVHSERNEDKTLLWLSRSMGTQCVKENDAFVQGSEAYITWRFYADQISDSFIAFSVELTGMRDGVIYGNLYELDFFAHASEVAAKAVMPSAYIKTFEDGFVVEVPYDKSSYGYYLELVSDHGRIVDSLAEPQDKELHASIISEQKMKRSKMKENSLKVSLTDQIKEAEAKAIAGSSSAPDKEQAPVR